MSFDPDLIKIVFASSETATPINKGKVHSEGKPTDRIKLSIFKDTKTYDIAIRKLSEKDREKMGENRGFLKKLFWKPLTFNVQGQKQTILVNINSAVKRLGELGLKRDEVLNALELKDGELFIKRVNEKLQRPLEEISDPLLSRLTQKLSLEQVNKIKDFVDQNQSKWIKDIQEKRSFLLSKKKTGLARTIQVNPDGTIYVLFNSQRSGDKVLGKGAFKKAKLAINLYTGETVVRTTQFAETEAQRKSAQKELDVALALSGLEGIARTYAFTTVTTDGTSGKKKIGFLLEYYNAGELSAALKGEGEKLSPKDRKFIAQKIIKGLDGMHDLELIHRDLKPQNIFIKRDPITKEIIDAVIADFGTVCTTEEGKNGRKEIIGTRPYCSPEFCVSLLSIQKGESLSRYFPKHDVWALGLVLLELYRSAVPEWAGKSFKEIVFWLNKPYPFTPISELQDDWLPEPANKNSMGHLIWEMLRPDPTKRLSSQESLQKFNEISL